MLNLQYSLYHSSCLPLWAHSIILHHTIPPNINLPFPPSRGDVEMKEWEEEWWWLGYLLRENRAQMWQFVWKNRSSVRFKKKILFFFCSASPKCLILLVLGCRESWGNQPFPLALDGDKGSWQGERFPDILYGTRSTFRRVGSHLLVFGILPTCRTGPTQGWRTDSS